MFFMEFYRPSILSLFKPNVRHLDLGFLIIWNKCKIRNQRNITIHHEFPCRIEISHPKGRNFNQGRGLPSPWLNSDPEGEISLSYMDRLMVDCFSPTFSRFFVGT